MERTEFLQRRKTGIGGSDVAAVLGASPWKTPYQLWLDKTTDDVSEKESDILHFGQMIEPVIANEFARRNNVKVQVRNNMYRHKEHPELVANIDRYIVGGAILECKTCSAWASGKFGKTGDDVPDQYLLQVQHYMHVTGIHEAYLAVLIGGNEYRQFEIPYDRELAEFAAGKCVDFWQNYVIKQIPPPATVNDDLVEYFTANAGASIEATPEISGIIFDLKELKSEEKEIKARIDALSDKVKLFAGENEIITSAGAILATWKQQKDRTVTEVDWAGICDTCDITQALIDKYTTTSTRKGNRPLLVK